MENNQNTEAMLKLLTTGSQKPPTADEFKQLILKLDNHRVLAKVFLLEGTPHVFANSPMKYVIFREQVGDKFNVGSQDVCIVGSAKLGFSHSPHKFGVSFSEKSDVDVVVISEPMFYEGSRALFGTLNRLEPAVYKIRPHLENNNNVPAGDKPVVKLEDWKDVKEAMRNYVFDNFNPGLLPDDHPLKRDVFEKISSTAGLFLALHPQVFVSRIRARFFRTWKAAEDYYSNTLKEVKSASHQREPVVDLGDEDEGEPLVSSSEGNNRLVTK